MTNPVIAEVTRGGRVESHHRGSYVVLDGQGSVMAQAGDVDHLIYPRSAMKLIQALPMIESGAADALGFDDTHLAMACSSHSGSPRHAETASAMLGRAGLSEPDLACGPHWPLFRINDTVAMAQSGETPTKLHNNCSGKHASFLAGCVHCDLPVKTYVDTEHPWQREVRATLESVCSCLIGETQTSSDGCNAPTYAMPLKNLALGFQRLFAAQAVSTNRTKAAERLAKASMANPLLVAGEGRYCTKIMEAGQGRLYAKLGAEGVYVAGIPDLGIAMAMKCDDGTFRAVEVLVAQLLMDALNANSDHDLADTLRPLTTQSIKTHAGDVVGEVRAIP